MSDVHIYTAKAQPATSFKDYTFDPPTELGYKKHFLLWAECCGRRRLAKNMVVQCYYDVRRFWCASGKGCKDQKVIDAAKRRQYRNRSLGQKRRWENTRHSVREAANG